MTDKLGKSDRCGCGGFNSFAGLGGYSLSGGPGKYCESVKFKWFSGNGQSDGSRTLERSGKVTSLHDPAK